MNMNRRLCRWMLTAVALVLCITSCKDDDATPVADGSPADIITLNVDVVLPASIQAQWKNVIDWAQENIAKAQKKL